MNSKTNHATAREPLTRMTAARSAKAMKGAEKVNFEDTKPLPPVMATAWERAKRGHGRPRIGKGAEKVLVSMDKRLLLVTDALARRKGLDRSELVARAIREMLERDAAEHGNEAEARHSITIRRPKSRKKWTEEELLKGVIPAICGPDHLPDRAGKELI